MALGRHAGRAGTEIEPPLTWSEGVGGSQSDVGGGAGVEDAKQEGASGWFVSGSAAPCLFKVSLCASVLAKNRPGSRCLSARASTTEREMAGKCEWASQKQRRPAQALREMSNTQISIHSIPSRVV